MGGRAILGTGRCGGGTDTLCVDLGRTWVGGGGGPSVPPRKLLPARLCVVLTVLSLRADELEARFEKFWKVDMMLCGLCAERCDGERLGELSAAYGWRCCWSDDRPGEPGEDVGSGAGADGGVAGGGPLGGVNRFGSTPWRDQRLYPKSNDERGRWG